ncbi:hypothetical protein GMSM_40750 [Geomonas sp. Red276]
MADQETTAGSSLWAVGAAVVVLLIAYLNSYTLFHTLVEITTVAIGFSLFILTWNSSRFLTGTFLSALGIGYAFAGLSDLLHALAFANVILFHGSTANLAMQFWISARLLQGATCLLAPLMVSRRIGNHALFAVFLLVEAVVVTLIFTGRFPECYQPGTGITPFKIGSEYLVVAMLAAAAVLIARRRDHLAAPVSAMLVASMVCTIVAELCLVSYPESGGMADLSGHLLKMVAFYLICRAIVVVGMKEPLKVIFWELSKAKEELARAHDNLEREVKERTAELRAKEEKYRALIESANDFVFVHPILENGNPGPFVEVNGAACEVLGYSREELASLTPLELDAPECRGHIPGTMEKLRKEGKALFETVIMAKDGSRIPVEVSSRVVEIAGRNLLFSLTRDITERKKAEQALHEKQQRVADLALELSIAEEQERMRIATNLHDNIGQDLALLRLKIALMGKVPLPEKAATTLVEVGDTVDRVIGSVRSLTQLISPPVLEMAGLEAALEWQAKQVESDYGVRVEFVDDGREKGVAKEVASVLYFAARELLINVAKHAQTDTARLSIRREGGRLFIEVEDWGKGFEPGGIDEFPTAKGRCFGLFNVRRRIVHLGGSFVITSRPGEGTQAVISVPLPE